jgi:hypothetical protein
MYQALKAETPDANVLKEQWARFEDASERTFAHLSKTIDKH